MEFMTVAGPTVATMTSYTMMTFVDKWLVSRLGPEYIGAQGNGGLVAWVPQSIAIGVFNVVNTYVAQNMGAGRPERGPAYAWNAIWIAIAYWLVVIIPFAMLLPYLFALARIDPHQAGLATEYGQILLFGAVLSMCTRAVSQFFYGMHRASVVMTAGITANIVNLLVGAVLVFGNGPIPADLGMFGRCIGAVGTYLDIAPRGIRGSAEGTVIATAVECAIPLWVFLSPRLNTLYKTRAAWRFSWPHTRDILKLGWPNGLMFGNEMICWGFFMVYLVSHFGPQHASAGWIAHQYMSLSFMPAVGISVAATAVVGKYMGMKRPDIAEKRAWLGVKLAMVYMGLCAVAFILFRAPLTRFFIEKGATPEQVAELVRLGSAMLIAAACFQLFDAMAMVFSGALRGAGDTVFPGVATVVASWTIIVLGGLGIIHFFPGLGSIGPWIAAALYIAVLAVLLLGRFMTGKWKSIKLLEHSAGGRPTIDPTSAAAMTTDGVM